MTVSSKGEPAGTTCHNTVDPTVSSQQTVSILPPPSASVEEVRRYIKTLLVTQHNTTYDYAEEVVAKWRLGRGWTLRESSADQFIACFGDDVGPYLYRDVQEDLLAEKRSTTWDAWAQSGTKELYWGK